VRCVDEKIKLKVSFCSFEITYFFLKILPYIYVTRFKDPKAEISTLKMLTGRPPPVTSLFWRIFPAAKERSALENVRPITEKGILRRISVNIFKISK
jgi:hypothetical protein